MSEQDEMRGHFVLVAIGEKTTNEGINHALRASHDLNESIKSVPNIPCWLLWLAGDDASSMPVDCRSEATSAPISKDFKSPYTGKELAGLIDIVRQASKEAYLNPRYFVVVDERTEKDGSVMLCQIDPVYDDEPVISFRVTAAQSASILQGVVVQSNFQDKKEIVDKRKEGESDILR